MTVSNIRVGNMRVGSMRVSNMTVSNMMVSNMTVGNMTVGTMPFYIVEVNKIMLYRLFTECRSNRCPSERVSGCVVCRVSMKKVFANFQ
jgi:hypothetical protein